MDNFIASFVPLFKLLGIENGPNGGSLLALLFSLVIFIIGFLFWFTASKQKDSHYVEKKPVEKTSPPVSAQQPIQVEKETKVETVSWASRLKKGLSRSRLDVWGKLGKLFSGPIDEEAIEQIEELLYAADLGPTATKELLDKLQSEAKDLEGVEHKQYLKNYLKEKLSKVQADLPDELFSLKAGSKKPYVVMIVGVNGAGKTTTIGKLASKLTQSGAKVVVGACDTFRAAAVDQLEVWCKRANASIVRAKENSAPSGVGYQALELAINTGADYCLLDTAGRLHTKGNLMEELDKSKRVLTKLMPDAPHQVLLVLDAIAGQNSIRQAQEFHKTLGLTGLIFTKCDGSSKAGAAVGIVQELGIPIAYIGVGESVEDINKFEVDEYLSALLDL